MVERAMEEQEKSEEQSKEQFKEQSKPQEQAASLGQSDKLARLKQERDDLFDRLARAQAEFENYRKRSQREQEEFRHYAVSEAVKLFIPILDNFNLALKHESSSADDLRKGLELIRKQMEDALAKLGVREVETRGAEFNPHHHEAVEMVESGEHADNQVVEELQRGYKLRDRLLRPAMVRVAKNK